MMYTHTHTLNWKNIIHIYIFRGEERERRYLNGVYIKEGRLENETE